MSAISKIFDWLSNRLMLVGGVLLILMMSLTCIDVVGRMFRHPLFGTYELVSFMAALVVAASLPDSHVHKQHIGVEVLLSKFSPRVQNIVELITELVSLILFILVTWQMFIYGMKILRSGEVSMNLGLPTYLIIFAVGFGFVLFCAAILKNIVDTIRKLRKG